jgi:hypothetical protein
LDLPLEGNGFGCSGRRREAILQLFYVALEKQVGQRVLPGSLSHSTLIKERTDKKGG